MDHGVACRSHRAPSLHDSSDVAEGHPESRAPNSNVPAPRVPRVPRRRQRVARSVRSHAIRRDGAGRRRLPGGGGSPVTGLYAVVRKGGQSSNTVSASRSSSSLRQHRHAPAARLVDDRRERRKPKHFISSRIWKQRELAANACWFCRWLRELRHAGDFRHSRSLEIRCDGRFASRTPRGQPSRCSKSITSLLTCWLAGRLSF